MSVEDTRDSISPRRPLRAVAREWTRIGLIGFGGPAIPLADALSHAWQAALLAAATAALLLFRRGVVTTLLVAGVVGALVVGI